MILLLDIGNTNTHLGLASPGRILRHTNIPTSSWTNGRAAALLKRFVERAPLEGACMCTVVPRSSPSVRRTLLKCWGVRLLELRPANIRGVGIDYPRPSSIGQDRLANAVAARHFFGAPSLVVDFGTAVTFDVVNRKGNYVGGIIAPGLSAMTDYLHEKTALLPRIRIREIDSVIGKSTEQAMRIGAVHGYRGLIRELISELKAELGTKRLPIIATGGCAELIGSKLSEVTAIAPLLTLEGVRLVWQAHHA